MLNEDYRKAWLNKKNTGISKGKWLQFKPNNFSLPVFMTLYFKKIRFQLSTKHECQLSNYTKCNRYAEFRIYCYRYSHSLPNAFAYMLNDE